MDDKSLRLPSGVEIATPRALLRGYVHNRYSLYDGVVVPRDNVLGAVEIALSIMINSQISGNTAAILDRVVEAHYWPALRVSSRGSSWGDYATKLIEVFCRDLLSVHDQVRDLAEDVGAAGTPLTECRILEVLMWSTLSENQEWYLSAS